MSRQRLRQSFINWKSDLSLESCALKAIYNIKDHINTNKNKELIIKMNPSVINVIESSYENELTQIKKQYKVVISFEADIGIENTKIEIVNEIKTKKKVASKKSKKVENKTKKNLPNKDAAKKHKTNKKPKAEKPINPIKEIKNKKKGWWQT